MRTPPVVRRTSPIAPATPAAALAIRLACNDVFGMCTPRGTCPSGARGADGRHSVDGRTSSGRRAVLTLSGSLLSATGVGNSSFPAVDEDRAAWTSVAETPIQPWIRARSGSPFGPDGFPSRDPFEAACEKGRAFGVIGDPAGSSAG